MGVRESKGEYIAFVDSDDWVNENFLEDFWDKAEETKADVVCCEFYYTFASGFKICVYPGMNKIMEAKKDVYKRQARTLLLSGFLPIEGVRRPV